MQQSVCNSLLADMVSPFNNTSMFITVVILLNVVWKQKVTMKVRIIIGNSSALAGKMEKYQICFTVFLYQHA